MLRIEAVLSEGERSSLLGAVEHLRHCFAESGYELPIEVHFHSTIAAITPSSGPAIVVASFLGELAVLEDPFPDVEQRLRNAFATLSGNDRLKLFLCTIYRRTNWDQEAGNAEPAQSTIERIRRLNLLAIQLSHTFGINIIDFDRSFAHVGGRTLHVDFRLSGAAAVEFAKYVIVSTFFAAGLDDFCSPELQEKAEAVHGQDHKRSLTQPNHELAPDKYGYRKAHKDRNRQTFAVSPRLPRTPGDLWQDLRRGRISVGEAIGTIVRAGRRQLFRRRAS